MSDPMEADRVRLLQEHRDELRSAYAYAVECGYDGPLMLLLDTRDPTAKELAMALFLPGRVERRASEGRPVIIFTLDRGQAERPLRAAAPKAAEIRSRRFPAGHFYVAVVSHGGCHVALLAARQSSTGNSRGRTCPTEGA